MQNIVFGAWLSHSQFQLRVHLWRTCSTYPNQPNITLVYEISIQVVKDSFSGDPQNV